MEKTNETNIIDALVQNTPGLVAVKPDECIKTFYKRFRL